MLQLAVVINSFSLDYGQCDNVSHLKFASCYVRDTHCSCHFNFANFVYRKICKINVLPRFLVIKYEHDPWLFS